MSYAPFYLVDDTFSEPRAEVILPGASFLRFWLPLVLFAFALLCAEHSTFYASPHFSDRISNTDLALAIGSSNTFRQIGYLSLGAIGIALLLMPASTNRSINRWLLAASLLTIGWLLLSMLWADDFVLSLKRSLVPMFIFLGAIGVAKQWQPRQACLFAVIISSGFLVWGIYAEIGERTFLQGPTYAFRGTLHPNDQAVNCAALCLASASLYCGSPAGWRRGLWLMPFVTGAVLLVLTRSRTATFACLLALLVFWMMGATLSARLWIVGGLFTVAVLAAFYMAFSRERSSQTLVEIIKMGRDQKVEDVTSLTGRVPIWIEVLRDVAKQPFAGYGYGTFWTPERVVQYSYIHKWEFHHAHSVYLETLLNVGAIGLSLGIAVMLIARRAAIRAYHATSDPSFRFFAAVLVMALVHGFLDTNFVFGGFASMLALICIAMLVFHSEPATNS